MISDITLGQFFPGRSLLHRLDPRSKLLLAVGFIVAVFLVNNPAGLIFLTLLTLGLIPLGSIPARTVFRSVRPILFLLLFTSLINLFLTTGEGEALVSFWIFHIYTEGIYRAVFMTVRATVLIIGSSLLLTYTTSPIALTDGIESLLSPLKLLHIPVHAFAMMMTIALRFIPTLVEETEKIMNAQKSRGADFTSGNLIRRAKALVPILVPLFVSAFKRAEELATAMECRCYRGDKNRTKLVKLTYRGADILTLAVGCVLLALIILSRILPYRFLVEASVYQFFFHRVA